MTTQPRRHSPSRRSALFLLTFSLTAALCTPRSAPATTSPPILKLYVDHPGVYAVTFEQLVDLEPELQPQRVSDRLRLSHQGTDVPLWVEDDRLLFLAGSALFEPSETTETVPMAVLLLYLDAAPAAPRTDPQPRRAKKPERLPLAEARRLRVFEQDQLRAPLVLADDLAGVKTLWFWAMLTQQRSSTLVVEVGELADLDAADAGEVEVRVRLLGWSKTTTPEGVSQHELEVRWNGARIGVERWDGRLMHEVRIQGIPAERLHDDSADGGHSIQVKIPERQLDGEVDPLIDIAYLDRVELRYPARPPLGDAGAPLLLDGAEAPRWLADAAGDHRLFSTAGWQAVKLEGEGEAGWVIPASTQSEVWIAGEAQLRQPLALEPITHGARELAAEVEYVLLAPPTLLEGAERLAQFHRSRGLRTAVVDVTAVYDAYGDGVRSPRAIRTFLQHQFERREALRYVLLVGDADWLQADDRTPYRQTEQPRRNRIPTWTYLSHFGPVASDHFYAMDPQQEALPRFAVGRLPVADAAQLEVVVDKILRQAAAPSPSGPFQVLLLSDQSLPSLKRHERLLEFLTGEQPRIAAYPPPTSDSLTLDEAVLAGFARQPDLVYFGGHGSRYLWQLGDPEQPRPETFFDREDVVRLPVTARLPAVISVSCATAPFDHPSADSLGEAMLLHPDRGTLAYLGAGVLLSTPRRFGEAFLLALTEEGTVGDMMVRAKRQARVAHASYAYNLLGDPALPVR